MTFSLRQEMYLTYLSHAIAECRVQPCGEATVAVDPSAAFISCYLLICMFTYVGRSMQYHSTSSATFVTEYVRVNLDHVKRRQQG